MSKALVAYYSRAGENYVSGTLKKLPIGNTEAAADIIAKITGADTFRIEQVIPYSESYSTCTAQAKDDQQNGARPQLKIFPDSLDDCDVIYLGYPNNWNTMPMAVFTFLEHFDFTGKTIMPFCTHEGSGMGKSEADIKKLCPTANVKRGLAVYGSRVGMAEKDIERWIKKI